MKYEKIKKIWVEFLDYLYIIFLSIVIFTFVMSIMCFITFPFWQAWGCDNVIDFLQSLLYIKWGGGCSL